MKARKQRRIDLLVSGTLDGTTFKDQETAIRTEISGLETVSAAPVMDEVELASLLEFAGWVMPRLAGVWAGCSLPNKLRIQKAVFPSGLVVGKEGIGTASLPVFFKLVEEAEQVSAGVLSATTKLEVLASPGGFEPPFSP